MKRNVIQLLGEAKAKMNGYVGLLTLRYANLCVKAEAASLLPVTIVVDNEEMNIEQLAEVGIPKEDVLAVVPKNRDLLFDIGKGVMTAHPEFKMDIVQNENNDDEEDKYLTFTMPEVNKDRHDLLESGVDGLHDQCKTKIDAVMEQYTARLVQEMAGATPEIIDEVKEQLEELYDFYDKTLEQMTSEKKKEIEEAYQRYVATQDERTQQQQEMDAAHSSSAGISMKMGEENQEHE